MACEQNSREQSAAKVHPFSETNNMDGELFRKLASKMGITSVKVLRFVRGVVCVSLIREKVLKACVGGCVKSAGHVVSPGERLV